MGKTGHSTAFEVMDTLLKTNDPGSEISAETLKTVISTRAGNDPRTMKRYMNYLLLHRYISVSAPNMIRLNRRPRKYGGEKHA